ncbi:MAG: ParB/RepB/Spo0J family partition protein [Lachnospiraceae bacterium]|nr:ParB/RepB/Spo0J family partition protein [Lachnospiraceae bacterium]
MAVRKSGLGKGLDSLIPDHQSEKAGLHTESEESGSNDGVVMVKISKVEPNKNQPRKQFDEDSLLELADSIKLYGVLQPLLVLDKGNYYEIIAGERRWRAAKLAGIKEIPVLIKEYTEREIVEISLIENIQREDLNPIEEAIAYKRLLEDFNLKQDEIAERVAKSRTAVTNSIRLLKLDEKVQQMLIDEMISTGHARALLAITDSQEQVNLANQVFDEKLSVRETEKLIKKLLEPAKRVEKKEEPALDAAYEQMEEKMKGIIGTKVTIHRKKKDKGKIEIEYYSQDELERIIDIFESIG